MLKCDCKKPKLSIEQIKEVVQQLKKNSLNDIAGLVNTLKSNNVCTEPLSTIVANFLGTLTKSCVELVAEHLLKDTHENMTEDEKRVQATMAIVKVILMTCEIDVDVHFIDGNRIQDTHHPLNINVH